jgi:hypothetical protein
MAMYDGTLMSERDQIFLGQLCGDLGSEPPSNVLFLVTVHAHPAPFSRFHRPREPSSDDCSYAQPRARAKAGW